ncbi:unnamed protein product [Toxocara canis]|uniref:ZP domain-containing protein n=1 Tax=Toxocara canis TaxID=6265 RepID=A0A183UWS5_TOXCA|nr:unnamed protein product [Toxocara canis]
MIIEGTDPPAAGAVKSMRSFLEHHLRSSVGGQLLSYPLLLASVNNVRFMGRAEKEHKILLETACDGSPNMKRRVLSAAIENDYLIIIAKCTLETAPRIVYNTSTEWPQSDANKSFPQQLEAEKMRLIKASVQNSILDRREQINEIVKGVTSTTFLIIYGAVMFLLLLLMVGLCAVSIIVRRPLTKQQRMALRRRRREQAILLRARRRAKRRAASANRTVAQTSAATGTTRLDTEVAIGVKG